MVTIPVIHKNVHRGEIQCLTLITINISLIQRLWEQYLEFNTYRYRSQCNLRVRLEKTTIWDLSSCESFCVVHQHSRLMLMLFAACGSTSPCFNTYCDGYQHVIWCVQKCNSQLKLIEIDIKVICRSASRASYYKYTRQKLLPWVSMLYCWLGVHSWSQLTVMKFT